MFVFSNFTRVLSLTVNCILKMAVRNGCACILVVGVSEIVEEALSRQAVSEK